MSTRKLKNSVASRLIDKAIASSSLPTEGSAKALARFKRGNVRCAWGDRTNSLWGAIACLKFLL
ncbi:hypothetical protein [Dendronalium sp. ChiSLP03b]|uniref:hypothetical protein n=1 Tax=Dendronalium sp. ChiSLP03b TaxID=3075381 RepID=UPI002AD5799D|nr:hypothetical protein [Dendronalium sp. ChiSLP03b]MDZ8208621.1 hypothetical protein [Dendronalium sp. ChiSLP03b]